MSTAYKLTRANDCLRLEIEADAASSYEDYERAVREAEAKAVEEGLELQTFVDAGHMAELDFFFREGFYVANSMIIMEKELERDDKEGSGETADPSISKQEHISILDIEKEGLAQYLAANKAGFDGVQDPEDTIRYELGLPGGRIYILEEGGEIVSSVTVWDIDGDTAATENIFTIPLYREQGLAWELLSHVLTGLYRAGKKKARLSVYGDDGPAMALYQKADFQVTGVKLELRY